MSDTWEGRGEGCNLIGLATPLLDSVFALQDAIFGGFTKLEVRAGFENTGMFLGDGFLFIYFLFFISAPKGFLAPGTNYDQRHAVGRGKAELSKNTWRKGHAPNWCGKLIYKAGSWRSSSSRFAGTLKGNFMPAANGDVSMGMCQCFNGDVLKPQASSQEDSDADLYVHSHLGLSPAQ